MSGGITGAIGFPGPPGSLIYTVTLRSEWRNATYTGQVAVEASQAVAGAQVPLAGTLGIRTVYWTFAVMGKKLPDSLSTGATGGILFGPGRQLLWLCADPANPAAGAMARFGFALSDGNYGLSLCYSGDPSTPPEGLGWSLSGPEGGLDQGEDVAITGPGS